MIYIYTNTYIHTLTHYLGQHVQARRQQHNLRGEDRKLALLRLACNSFVSVCVHCSVLQCIAMCCSVLQCVAVCCSVLQCVAMCCMQSSPFFYCTTNVLHYPLICATRRIHTCFIFERVTSHTIPTYMIITSLSTHSIILSYKCTNTYVHYKTTIQTRLQNKLVCLFIFTYV